MGPPKTAEKAHLKAHLKAGAGSGTKNMQAKCLHEVHYNYPAALISALYHCPAFPEYNEILYKPAHYKQHAFCEKFCRIY